MIHHSLRWLPLVGFWSSLTFLLMQPAVVQASPLIATSCLPGGADAPRSQGIVIDREQIAAQTRFNQNLRSILTTQVPGFSASSRHHLRLRGRRVRILVDGVPVAADDQLLSTLTPDLVERIEIIPGPSMLCSASLQLLQKIPMVG